MKKAKFLTTLLVAAVFVLACCFFTACDPDRLAAPLAVNMGVVKAFKAIDPVGEVITQTAVASGEKYAVTVIATDYVAEYVLDQNFNVETQTGILGAAPAQAAMSLPQPSALEKAYAEALRLSGLDSQSVTGFDFDRERYMGESVYKVEIEEIGAKYKYIFAESDMRLLDSEIEFENDAHTGSYIDQSKAFDIALRAAGVSENVSATAAVRSVFEGGKKVHKVSFDHDGYRYDVSVDAVGGDIVKFSKSRLDGADLSSIAQTISADDAKSVAFAFVFADGEEQTDCVFRKVKLDREDGQFVYEVELLVKNAEYEFEISATDGAILDVEIDQVKPATPAPLPENRQFITRDEAIAAVKQFAGNGVYILEVEIDKENGKYIYEIEARVGGVAREYKIDALTGEILNAIAPSEVVISDEEAVQIATRAFGLENAVIDHKIVKFEHEHGALCYTVKLYVGAIEYEAEIDGATGAILSKEIDREDDLPPTMGAPTVTQEQAIAKLKEFLGDQTNVVIGEVELESEYGRQFYDIEVRVDSQEIEYFVDAFTGDVGKKADIVSGGKAVIGEEAAFALAIKEFGVESRQADIRLRKIKLDRDDGRLCYEIEFFIDDLEYELELDAETGAVLERSISYD